MNSKHFPQTVDFEIFWSDQIKILGTRIASKTAHSLWYGSDVQNSSNLDTEQPIPMKGQSVWSIIIFP